jgi:DNA replication and repair protein RecF
VRVTRLELTDYRNYARASLDLEPGPTVFVGRNGQGKTNLVESIGYLSTLGSHRVSGEQALIRSGADAAVIRVRLEHAERSVLVEVQLNRGAPNRALVNRSAVKPRELPRTCHSVLFAPEDLAIVRGEPGIRRRFLDELLVQRMPRLAGVQADYDRALRQRNSLLKSARTSGLREAQLSTLDIWDERLVGFGTEIVDARVGLIEELAQPLREAYRSIVDADHAPKVSPVLSIDGADPDEDRRVRSPARGAEHVETPDGFDTPVHGYSTSDSTAERFRAALAAVRRKEIDRGITLVGPHRDDMLLELNGLPAKGYASHGESWSFALSLVLASAELLRRDSRTGDPILVLDDVFAELDQLRRRRLAAAIADFEQVLITAAVLEDVPETLVGTIVQIDDGEIVEAVDA